MVTFADIVDAADQLTVDEQETLIDILRHRVASRTRDRISADIEQARADYASGNVRKGTAEDLMKEIRSGS
jgi:hypothetical protein